MSRVLTTVVAAIIFSRLLCAGGPAEAATEPPIKPVPHKKLVKKHVTPKGAIAVARAHKYRHYRAPAVQTAEDPSDDVLSPLPLDRLTRQERELIRIAGQNGDHDFLVVDKSMGRILLFEDGVPVFMGSALTGQSKADELPEGAIGEKFTTAVAVVEKVTPAGRFTVTPGYNEHYGPLFDVNQIKGKDWGIAIHPVYLGIPSEHRDIRLQSSNANDKHISYGCINVAPETITLLMRELPSDRPTVLYILPQDETQTETLLTRHNS